jgi:hypothetical protein
MDEIGVGIGIGILTLDGERGLLMSAKAASDRYFYRWRIFRVWEVTSRKRFCLGWRCYL